ncbi:MAG TPA: GPP34 family phosphoprotein [Actinomycetes bacterium]
MELPASLPRRLYLLAYDPRRRRLSGRSQLGYLLRAAALTDLLLRGLVADDRGKVVVGRPADPLDDPVLGAVLRQVAESRPRSWSHWVRSGQRAMRLAVREQLEADGWIRVEPRRVLGVFPVSRVTVQDTRVLEDLAAIVARTLGAGLPAARVDPSDAALVALAAAGELPPAISRRQRREHRQRIARLSERAGPAVPALRRVIQQLRASAAS